MQPRLWARGQFLSHPSDGPTKPVVNLQEVCYTPTWPWGYHFDRNEEEKIDMTPRCIGAVAPYNFLLQSGPGRHPP